MDNFRNAPGYRPDIDGIRAFSVVAILLYHAWPAHFSALIIGVDSFFVISGFIITTIICRDIKANRFTWLHFYRKRILRIFPPLIILLAACLGAGYFLLTADEYARIARNARAGAFFGANFSIMAESGYFDVTSSVKPLLHLWTLAIEEQFYIIYPLILLMAGSISGKILIVLALGGISFFLGTEISAWLLGNPDVTHYYSPFTRAFDLCAGALLALLTFDKPAHTRKKSLFYAVCGVAILALTCFMVTPAMRWPCSLTLLPVAGCILLIHAGPGNPVSRILLCNPMAVFIGLVSYELYLWHWPLLAFANILAGGAEYVDSLTKIILLGVALLLAFLVFAYVELPLRKKYRMNTMAVTILLCLLIMVGLTAHYILRSGGLPDRIAEGQSPKSWEVAKTREDVARAAPLYPDWIKYTDKPNQVALEDTPDKIEIAIIGDSHAAHLYPGLAEEIKEKIGVFPASGQAPYPQIATLTTGAENFRKNGWKLISQAYDTVLKNPNIKYVILAHDADYSIDDCHDPADPDAGDASALMAKAMRQSLEMLKNAGKKVLIVLDNPTLDFDPAALENRPIPFLNNRKAGTMKRSVAEKSRGRQWYNAICKKVAADFDNVYFMDLFDVFCDEEQCISQNKGKLLYFDRNHFTYAGSRFAAPHIAQAIELMKKDEKI